MQLKSTLIAEWGHTEPQQHDRQLHTELHSLHNSLVQYSHTSVLIVLNTLKKSIPHPQVKHTKNGTTSGL